MIKTQRNKKLDEITKMLKCIGDNLLKDNLKEDLIYFSLTGISFEADGVSDTPDYEESITAGGLWRRPRKCLPQSLSKLLRFRAEFDAFFSWLIMSNIPG